MIFYVSNFDSRYGSFTSFAKLGSTEGLSMASCESWPGSGTQGHKVHFGGLAKRLLGVFSQLPSEYILYARVGEASRENS